MLYTTPLSPLGTRYSFLVGDGGIYFLIVLIRQVKRVSHYCLNLNFLCTREPEHFSMSVNQLWFPCCKLSGHILCFSNQFVQVLYPGTMSAFCLFYLLCIFSSVCHMPFHFGYFWTDEHFSFLCNHNCRSFPLFKQPFTWLRVPHVNCSYHLNNNANCEFRLTGFRDSYIYNEVLTCPEPPFSLPYKPWPLEAQATQTGHSSWYPRSPQQIAFSTSPFCQWYHLNSRLEIRVVPLTELQPSFTFMFFTSLPCKSFSYSLGFNLLVAIPGSLQ